MNLRPYQQKAVDWLCEHERGLVVAPAGSGKTVIAAAALDEVMRSESSHPAIGWVANTKEQVSQANVALNSFNLPHRTSVLTQCAATGQDWRCADVLIVDEAHHATAPEWKKQIETCKGVRWGFTATPWGRDAKRNAELKAMFGGNVFVIDREEVGQNLAPARVVWLDACDEGLPERIEAETDKVLKQRMRFSRYQRMSPQQARGEVAWGVCCELGIRQNMARNAAALTAARAHTEQTLILCGMVDHTKAVAMGLPNTMACWGDMSKKLRQQVIRDFKAGSVQRLSASTLADEGFDAPCAEVLVLLSGGRNEARTIQRTGRVLRPHPGKTEAVIYDFKDSQIPLMARHAAKRAQIYEKLGYSGDFSWV